MTEHTHTAAPLIIPASERAERMATACINFLETLTPALRRKAEIAFEESERLRWHYIPLEMWERGGVSIGEMNDKQREAAFSLLACGLSEKGDRKSVV